MRGLFKRIFLSICAQVLFIGVLKATPLDPPVMHCANADANGNVRLRGHLSDPSGEFQQYDIYTHHSSRPFAPLPPYSQ